MNEKPKPPQQHAPDYIPQPPEGVSMPVAPSKPGFTVLREVTDRMIAREKAARKREKEQKRREPQKTVQPK